MPAPARGPPDGSTPEERFRFPRRAGRDRLFPYTPPFAKGPMTATSFVPASGWVAPFAIMLLSMAVLPLAAPRFWASNARKLALGAVLGLPVVVLYAGQHPAALLEVAGEYASFIILLGSLFVISGGVLVTGDIEARPSVNTAFLAIGAVLASLVGTTGASVLLVRPLLATNQQRREVAHTFVFFIFVVSNIGGCL